MGAVAVVSAPAGCGLTDSNADQSDAAEPDAGPDLDAGADAGQDAIDIGGPDGCPLTPVSDPLEEQAIAFPTGVPRRFFSWTTREQVDELRAGETLFSRSEREGLGRGFALESLADYAAAGSEPAHRLAGQLEAELFTNIRYAWTNPWATRLGLPGEDYGDQLLEIRLRPEAWIASFDGAELSIWNADDEPVPLGDALAAPERIGAIYFLRGAALDGPTCSTFNQGGNGYREFVLGNLLMVEQWALGTSELLERLRADIALIEQFAAIVRECPNIGYYEAWNADVACSWRKPLFRPGWDSALAMPSELYYPEAEALDRLASTLEGDLFEVDPLVVVPDE